MTELNFLADFVDVGILATCLGFGYILKHWIGRVPNWLIPTLLGVIGVGLSFWVSHEFTHEALRTGLLSGLAATGAFEVVKNIKNR